MPEAPEISKPFKDLAQAEVARNADPIEQTYEYAKTLIGQGASVPKPKDDDEEGYPKAARETQRLLDTGHAIIYGAVMYNPENKTYSRASALVKNPDGDTYDVVKITSSTSVKPKHREELAEPYYGFQDSGIAIDKAHLIHVNKDYIRNGDIDPKALLKKVNLTSKLKRPVIKPSDDDPQHSPEEIKKFLAGLEYPRYFLDYETVKSPVPLYDGTRPHQQVPFQFSLHVQHEPDGAIEHLEYLHTEKTDPRRALTEALIQHCGTTGSVLVYFQSFEKGRNTELAKAFPEHAAALDAINDRIVDLYLPFQKRWLYHPDQQGSASIKAVLPAFTDLSYDNLGIQAGDAAMQRYLNFVHGLVDAPAEQSQLWQGLRAYCKLDTFAMVKLLSVLEYFQVPRPIEELLPKTEQEIVPAHQSGTDHKFENI